MSSSAKEPPPFSEAWEKYSETIPDNAPADQVFSMKLAFHHSAMTTLKINAVRAMELDGPQELDPGEEEWGYVHIWNSYVASVLPDASFKQKSAIMSALQNGSFFAIRHLENVLDGDPKENQEEKLRALVILVAEIEAFLAKASGEIQ